MDEERTTKYVTATVRLVFHGDYVDRTEVTSYAEGWLDAGLEDRDDLRSWTISFGTVREITGDPEGYDQ
jgi:hypothetical protein